MVKPETCFRAEVVLVLHAQKCLVESESRRNLSWVSRKEILEMIESAELLSVRNGSCVQEA
jgi:hypothetical protein